MHPMRRMEEIKSTLQDAEESAVEVRAATRLLERSVPIGEILAAVVEKEFPGTLIAASRGCDGEEERAWLTLAAVGPRRARQILAWRASQLLDPAELAARALERRRIRAREFGRRAASAGELADAAAWRLLAELSGAELRALVRARPTLAGAYRRCRACRGRVPTRLLSPAPAAG
jgi:hypothetical protein